MSKAKSNRTVKKSKQKKKASVGQGDKRSIWITLGIIAGVTILAMFPLFAAGFVDIDDEKLLLNKAHIFLNAPERILSMSYKSPHFKPVTYLTWMLEYRLAGPNPFIYHFNNVLLHVLNTIQVFFLVRNIAPKFDKLKGYEFQVAFFTALLFGVHPMHVESVGWVIERKDLLYTCFYLLGMAGYIRYLNHGKLLPLALSAGAYFLSATSKAPGITLLPVLFLLDFVWQRKFSYKLFLEKIGHFAVFGYALVALGIIGRSGGEGSVAAMLTEKKLARAENIKEHSSVYGKAVLAALRALLWYLHSFIPVRLSLGYPREQIIGFFGPLIHVIPWILLSAGALLLRFGKRYRILFFAHVFFFLTLGPAIVRLGLGIGIYMSDRYVYLSLLGLIFLVVAWISTLKERSWLSAKTKNWILITLCSVCVIMSFRESRVWKSTETLWTNVIEKYPTVDYAYVNRGAFYREQGQYEKALADVNIAISLDDNANSRMQRGLIKRQMGDPKGALVDYDRAIELEPDDTQAHTNRGNANLDLRRFQRAILDYEIVLKKEPSNVKTRVNMAIAYSSLGDFKSAEEEFSKAERRGGNYADLYVNRAIMFFESKEYAKALKDYQRYLEFKPDDHQIYNDMGIVYSILGDYQHALESFTRAISISPVKDYYRYRAQAYEKLGNAAAAAQDRKMAQ